MNSLVEALGALSPVPDELAPRMDYATFRSLAEQVSPKLAPLFKAGVFVKVRHSPACFAAVDIPRG